jgi:hypothetical protein
VLQNYQKIKSADFEKLSFGYTEHCPIGCPVCIAKVCKIVKRNFALKGPTQERSLLFGSLYKYTIQWLLLG